MLAYGIYILLGDCFTSIWLAFVFWLYLRDLKILVEETLTNSICNSKWSPLRRILVVRFVINVYKAYTKDGCTFVLCEIFIYLKSLVVNKFDSKSSTFFSDVPKILTICGIYISLRYVRGPYSLLIFAFFLLVDMVFKFIMWVILKMLEGFGLIKRVGSSYNVEISRSMSNIISYWVILGMLLLIIASFLSMIFLLLLDLNQLRENIIGNTSIYKIIDNNRMMLDKVDGNIKPYLKKFLKVVHYHSDLPYEYDKDFFENNTSFQVFKNFTTELNITSPGNFISKVVVGWLTPESSHDSDLNDQYDNEYIKVMMKLYNIVADIYRDKSTLEINSKKIFDTLKAIFYFLVLIIIELANYLFYFIVFLSCLSYLVSMDKDIIHYGVAYLPIEETNTKTLILSSLLRSIRGVFLSPLKISITLSIVSWVILDAFGVKYLYIYSFLCVLITFLPVVSPGYLGIPAAFYLYFGQEMNGVICIIWFVVYHSITSSILKSIYADEMTKINPFLLFLSLVNGLYVFDIKGFLYGPILICLIHSTKDLLRIPDKPRSQRSKSTQK